MRSTFKILIVIAALLSDLNSFAQIKNVNTETVKIYGNCGMCKTTIEKAGNIKNIASVTWNKDTKMAMLSYDSKKTSQGEILKRIALSGYDSDEFLAPDDVYGKLHECCQYDRQSKPVNKNNLATTDAVNEHINHNHSEMVQNSSQLTKILDHYLLVKDALVKTDAGISSAKAAELVKAIKAVEMTELSEKEHNVWMKVVKDLTLNAEKINSSNDVSKQRLTFGLLSKSMYELVKIANIEKPVYYQHCPMFNNGKGANWLSLEKAIKNPYYGSQMLNCGNVVEILE